MCPFIFRCHSVTDRDERFSKFGNGSYFLWRISRGILANQKERKVWMNLRLELDLLTSRAFEREARASGSYHSRPENQANDFEKV